MSILQTSSKLAVIKLPLGWDLVRLKSIADIRYGLGQPPPERDGGVPMIRATDIDAGRIIEGNFLCIDPDSLPVERDPYLKEGEIIVVRSGAYTGDSAIVPAKHAGAVAGYDMVVTVKRAVPEFVGFCLLSGYVVEGQLLLLTLRAAQPHLNAQELGGLQVPLPPLPEQRCIAAYLDASCAAIDAAMAAKRRQIETLDSLRKSIISRAVTKGLNSAVQWRDSGIEWFDEIPAHWTVDRLKDVVAAKKDAIKVGPFGSDLLLSDMADEGIKVFNQRTVIDHDFESGIHFVSPKKYAEMKAFTVYPRDLLITTRGTIGRCAIVPETAQLGILHPCLMRVQTNRARLLPEYLALLIQECELVLRQLQMMSAATTIDVIYSESLKRTYMPLPPVIEQEAIINFIRAKDAELASIIAQIKKQIATLTAYSKSLIHECVTGQRRVTEVDVRHVEAQKAATSSWTPGHEETSANEAS